MYTADDYKQAFDAYAATTLELYEKMGTAGGILGVLGIGRRPGNDPCHERFYLEIKSAMQQTVSEDPDPETADAIADVIFRAKEEYKDEHISPYMFLAVEYLVIDLLPFLSREKTAALLADCKKLPRQLRTPSHKKLTAALEKAVRG